MVKLDRTFEPQPERQKLYEGEFETYRRLWPLTSGYLRGLATQS
jgi:hypothetical protein